MCWVELSHYKTVKETMTIWNDKTQYFKTGILKWNSWWAWWCKLKLVYTTNSAFFDLHITWNRDWSCSSLEVFLVRLLSEIISTKSNFTFCFRYICRWCEPAIEEKAFLRSTINSGQTTSAITITILSGWISTVHAGVIFLLKILLLRTRAQL